MASVTLILSPLPSEIGSYQALVHVRSSNDHVPNGTSIPVCIVCFDCSLLLVGKSRRVLLGSFAKGLFLLRCVDAIEPDLVLPL